MVKTINSWLKSLGFENPRPSPKSCGREHIVSVGPGGYLMESCKSARFDYEAHFDQDEEDGQHFETCNVYRSHRGKEDWELVDCWMIEEETEVKNELKNELTT